MANHGDIRAAAISAAAIAIGFNQEISLCDYKGRYLELFEFFADAAIESMAAKAAYVKDYGPQDGVWACDVDDDFGRWIAGQYSGQGKLPDIGACKATFPVIVKFAGIPF
ncbi:hypothetical protein DF134_35585 [Burkholderia stagnalis]|uniref:hypothetical protein n=1 Tax=Burkholderia stagnalis TaxID=1503054 RepID=UPI000F5989C7|nr:hypothetical protein [Burkholderia stagnalis]RQQ78686.1 hypothetical protein DF134_35585 [Burkholderia stagnalis]